VKIKTVNQAKTTLQFLLLISLIFLFVVQFATASQSPERYALPLPPVDQSSQQSHTLDKQNSNWTKHVVKIKRHGSLSEALDSVGLDPVVSFQIAGTQHGQWLTQLRAGDTLEIWLDRTNQLQKIHYPKRKSVHYQLTRKNNQFNIQKIEYPVETKIQTASGTIKHSFYQSGKDQGLSAQTIMNLADIFSWEIDFIRQLRPGDPFKVIYEKKFINGQYVGDGDILAAEVTTNGDQLHTAFLLRDKNGEKVGYYDQHKRNLRKAFLRNPVDYVRITSRYKPKRYHPVLKKWRAHRGVDYGGPVGTPIRVTGDGQIIKRRWSRSYGRVIYVKHAGRYVTVYAHMSKFGKYRQGDWVRQGQVIGYIGQSGLATGPHLHYEFRKKGHHVDPLRVKFPDAGPVPKKYRHQFVQYAELMSAQLDRLNPHTQLVSNFE